MERTRKISNRDAFSDDISRRILRRAAEIDALSVGNIRVADLRAAAMAAGISEAALEQALVEECTRADVSVAARGPLTVPARLKNWAQWAFSMVVGAATGALTRSLATSRVFGDPNPETTTGIVALGLFCSAMAMLTRGEGAQRRFQMINMATWTSFLSGWSLVHGGFFGDVISLSMAGLVLSASMGGLAIATRERARRQSGVVA
jgi:hypothetical protein